MNDSTNYDLICIKYLQLEWNRRRKKYFSHFWVKF